MQQSAKCPIAGKEMPFPTARLGYAICRDSNNRNHHNNCHNPNFVPACERSEKREEGERCE
eukprot:8076848-Ditylum_brightwellii.AAC.1